MNEQSNLTSYTPDNCEVCISRQCEYGGTCCKCHDYDYILACYECTIIYGDSLKEPTKTLFDDANYEDSMKNAELLRSNSPRTTATDNTTSFNNQRRKSLPIDIGRNMQSKNSKIVPKLNLPQHSPSFLMLWSSTSPISPASPHTAKSAGNITGGSSDDAESSDES